MPVGQRTGGWMLRQIFPQPLLLLRPGSATAEARGTAVCVEYNDVPRAEVIAVITLAFRPRSGSPVLKVRGGSLRGSVLVIAQRRARPPLEAPPSRIVAVLKVAPAPRFVRQVAGGKDYARNLLDQLRRGPGPLGSFATGNVSRSDQDGSIVAAAPRGRHAFLLWLRGL